MAVSGNVHVDNTDIGCSDHFLVWMELGRTAKNFKKEKRVIRRWRLERFMQETWLLTWHVIDQSDFPERQFENQLDL